MAGLAERRQRFRTLAQIFGVIIVLALAFVLLPWRPSAADRGTELNEARLQAKTLESEVAPLRGLPEKLTKARGDIATFYKERFPDRFSALPETLGKLAVEHHIKLSDVKYEMVEAEEIPGLRRVRMQAVLSGEYGNLVGFINGLERSKPFFVIDGITLAEEGGTSGGTVRLQIDLTSVLHGFPALQTPIEKPVGGRS